MKAKSWEGTLKAYRRLLGYLRPYIWPYFTMAMICMAVFSGTNALVPFLIKRVIDDIFTNKDRVALAIIPWVIIGVFTLRGLVNFGQSYLGDYVGLRILNDIRNSMNRHLQSQSLSFFHRNPTGTLISRITNDVSLVRSALTDSVASLMRDSMSLVGLIAAAFYMDWVLASIAFIVFPASVYPLTRMSKRIKRFTKRGQVAKGLLTSLLQESIQGNRIVKAFGMEQYEIDRFQSENRRIFKQSIRASRTQGLISPAMEMLAAFAMAAVLWYGGSSVISDQRTQGDFMGFMAAMFLLYQPFRALAKTYAVMQQGVVGAERIFEVLDSEPEIQSRPGATPAPAFARAIEFHNVCFGYARKLVLKNINLKIDAGEMVAIVGVSGVGKSTLADLVPRFYDVTAGEITIDGTDIREVTMESLRSQIGIVTQHTFLFNDTVKNNIAYGDPSQDMDHIIAAAKAAHAHEFIMAMPQGYDTMIGELGLKLSGGQRQRLAIARALLKDAPILILDEATSSLDTDSERLVQEALENLMTQRTTLVIAHRLTTIRKATRIVVLVDGMIAEEGTHDELLARKSEYSRLYTLQLLEDEGPTRDETVH
jgi:ATP-binding cassette, subfamily B, bacterial MsbA